MADQTTRVLAALKRQRTAQGARGTLVDDQYRSPNSSLYKADMPPAVASYQQSIYGHAAPVPLPRDPMQFLEGTFGPLTPIVPTGVNVPEDGDDRPGPRQREMPVGWNMPTGVPGSEGFKLASFGTIRMYADLYSVARAALQVRKSEIRGLEWDVMPTPEAEKKMRGDAAAHSDFAERRAVAVKFFRKPDPDYNKFGSYIDAVIEEMFSIDALSLYLHPTRKKNAGPFGSNVAALELISGSTIRPMVNMRGGRVAPPNVGYQQYLYGVPRSDLMSVIRGDDLKDDGMEPDAPPAAEYRGDQLFYLPYTQRAWTPYGFPPIERSIIPVITGLRKQQFQMDFFDEGTIPGNYISPGEQLGWTPNQLEIWQDQQNALAGDPAWKHKSIALPPGSKVFPMRPVALADQFDEIVMTQVCMAFDVMPMELGVSPKVSTTQSPGAANQMAKASQDTNERKSLKPTLAFLTDIFNVVIQEVWGQEDMRFVFEGLEEDEDENALVERLVQQVSFGFCSVDEARIALGKSPWGLPITSDPVFVSATAGMVPLGSIDPTSGKPMGTPPPQAIGAPPPAGGPPGAAPGATPVGGGQKPGGATTPPGSAPGGGASAKPGTGPSAPGQNQPPGAAKPGDPPDSNAPPPLTPEQEKLNESRDAAVQAHAGVQQQMHEDYAAGKPLEPPVRPPLAEANDDENGLNQASQTSSRASRTKACLSELDAMRRILRKTVPAAWATTVHGWDARYLDGEHLDTMERLVTPFGPDHAAAIVREEIVAKYGPSVAAIDIDKLRPKNFDVSAPFNSTDGQQGLAPIEIARDHECCGCGPNCTCGPGCTCNTNSQHISNNGPGADLNDAGLKASDVDPKAPGQATTAWLASQHYDSIAAHYADLINQACINLVDPTSLARDYVAGQRIRASNKSLPDEPWSWLSAGGWWGKLTAAIAKILGNLWTESFAVGQKSAQHAVNYKNGSLYNEDFWSSWQPGDAEAARAVAGGGLQKMLDNYGIATIKAITNTRMEQLADALAVGFDNGDSAETIAKAITPILDNKSRALMIADTEMARAATAGAYGFYKEANEEYVRWSPLSDKRVCAQCAANRDAGPVKVDGLFPSGVTGPPAHPNCRCALLPADPPDTVNPTLTKNGIYEVVTAGNSDLGKPPTAGLVRNPDDIVAHAPGEDTPTPVQTNAGVMKTADPVAAGLVVRSRASGRVLMIRRTEDPTDIAPGCWEFPGGKLEAGEMPLVAAAREWQEEVGKKLPVGLPYPGWTSSNGKYQGFVWEVTDESFMAGGDRSEIDDPDGTHHEALGWMDIEDLEYLPNLRPELEADLPTVVAAITPKMLIKAGPGSVEGDKVYQQLLPHYPAKSIAWVKRARWSGPHDVPFDQIDHDDMDSWAASHEQAKVDRFASRIKDGDDPDPVVLVSWPGRASLLDVDGHHRALGAKKAGKPVLAWVGVIDSADQKAVLETHSFQYTDANPGSTSANKASENDHHIAGTPYTYHHGWIPINPLANECHDGCGGHTKGGKYLPGHDAKNVKHLVEAVNSGAVPHSIANESLSHSPKLQDKLATKLGKPKPNAPLIKPQKPSLDDQWETHLGDGGTATPGMLPQDFPPGVYHDTVDQAIDDWADHDPELHVVDEPDPFGEDVEHQDSDEAILMDAPPKPTVDSILDAVMGKPSLLKGDTPDGRHWTASIMPKGTDSIYHITEKTGSDQQWARNREMTITYKGNGMVAIATKEPSGIWTQPGPDVPLASLQARTKVYQEAHKHLVKAEANEKAHNDNLPKPKPKPVGVAANAHPTAPFGPHKPSNKAAPALKLELEQHGELPNGEYGDANNSKAWIAQRLSKDTKADTESLIKAAYMGADQYTVAERDLHLKALKNIDQYHGHVSYDGSLSIKLSGQVSDYEKASWEPLTEDTLRRTAISSMIQNWAGTSNDTSVKSLTTQEAAIQEFGLSKDDTAPWKMTPEMEQTVEAMLNEHGPAVRAFLRAQYEATQADLKERGVTHVNLYRGMKFQSHTAPEWYQHEDTVKNAKIGTPPLRPLSSWTVNASTATTFSGGGGHKVILKSEVPVESILSWPRSGFGCLNEYELVTLAAGGSVTVHSINK